MYEFKYHRPGTVRQAANLLIKNEDAKLIAGKFFAERMMPETAAHLARISPGADTMMSMKAEMF